jgi:hypothetical protein
MCPHKNDQWPTATANIWDFLPCDLWAISHLLFSVHVFSTAWILCAGRGGLLINTVGYGRGGKTGIGFGSQASIVYVCVCVAIAWYLFDSVIGLAFDLLVLFAKVRVWRYSSVVCW